MWAGDENSIPVPQRCRGYIREGIQSSCFKQLKICNYKYSYQDMLVVLRKEIRICTNQTSKKIWIGQEDFNCISVLVCMRNPTIGGCPVGGVVESLLWLWGCFFMSGRAALTRVIPLTYLQTLLISASTVKHVQLITTINTAVPEKRIKPVKWRRGEWL